jgi:hypothetical protein
MAYSGFAGLAQVSDFASLNWGQSTATTNQIAIFATANYQSGSTSLTFPDLSGLTGFLPLASSGQSIYWSAQVQQGVPVGTNPPSGAIQYVGNFGTYTQP